MLLVEHGVDLKQTDFVGNTIWHEAAIWFATFGGPPHLFHEIRTLGADPSKANDRGRTPLHVLCEYDQWWLREGIGAKMALEYDDQTKEEGQTTMFEYLLQQCPEDVNSMDQDGITPLHLTSTFSAHMTKGLLKAGADATMTTHEGLNVFHLAARCRQSNTIGLVLDWFKTNKNTEELHRAINAKDHQGRSPLYYACASGRCQAVELLIKAGAKVETKTYDGSALNGCADLEEEQDNWQRSSEDEDVTDAGSVLIDDARRLKLADRRWNGYRMDRLDDILSLIFSNTTASSCRAIDKAIITAVARQSDYTVESHPPVTPTYR
jgi:ankyrin repeat protein